MINEKLDAELDIHSIQETTIVSSYNSDGVTEKESELSGTTQVVNHDNTMNVSSILQTTEHNDNIIEDSIPTATSLDEFTDILLHAWPLAIQRIDKGRRIAEMLQTVMKDRAQLEEAYAVGLEKIAVKLVAPPTESKGIQDVVSIFKKNVKRRAEQAREFSQSINTDVIDATLTLTIQNHFNVLRQISIDASNISKTLQNAQIKVKEAEKKLAILGQETFSLCREGQLISRSLSSQQTRLAIKALSKLQELRIHEQRYSKAVEFMNQSHHIYITQMKIILRSLEDMDTKRISCFKDALRKFIVFQTSLLRNCQYDLNGVIQVVEGLNEKDELNEFLLNTKTMLRNYHPKRTSDTLSGSPELLSQDEEQSFYEMKHWALLCLSPNGQESSSSEFRSTVIKAKHVSKILNPNFPAMESATNAARNLLKNTPLDKVVQTAAAHLSSIGLPGPQSIFSTDTDEPCRVPPIPSRPANLEKLPPEKILAWLSGENRFSSEMEKNKEAEDIACKKIRAEYDELLGSLWKFSSTDSETFFNTIHRLNDELSSSLRRNILISSLDGYRSVGSYCLPNMDALHILGLITEIFLEWSDRQWDVVAAQGMMILSQKFFAKGRVSEDPQACGIPWIWPHLRVSSAVSINSDNIMPDQIAASNEITETSHPDPIVSWFLHRIIYHLVIWNRVHFWEEALIFTISQEQQKAMINDSEAVVAKALDALPSTTIESCNNTLYSGLLENFGLCMIAFGIFQSQAIALIHKVCLQYHLCPEFSLTLLAPLVNDGKEVTGVSLPLAPFKALAHPLTLSNINTPIQLSRCDSVDCKDPNVLHPNMIKTDKQLDTIKTSVPEEETSLPDPTTTEFLSCIPCDTDINNLVEDVRRHEVFDD